MLWLTSCSPNPKQESSSERAAAAQALFDQAATNFHTPSAEATGERREILEQQAAAAYQQLLTQYPDQSFWAAQALRHLAHVRAAQQNVDEAVRLYRSVGQKYPDQDWEILQAWKSAADLLWESKRAAEAKTFYEQIVTRFDGTNQPSVVRLVVQGSKRRLEGP